jgi:O-antigen/teichoic acid export membrane protein
VPLLLAAYGESAYALVVLATSLSSYLAITAIGLPTGLVRHSAIWFSRGNIALVAQGSNSVFALYTAVGAANATIFLVLAVFGGQALGVHSSLEGQFTSVFLIGAALALVTWPAAVSEQLLAGKEDLVWLGKVSVAQEVARAIVVMFALLLALSIEVFFLLFACASRLALLFSIFRLRCLLPELRWWVPRISWGVLRGLIRFSAGIFMIGIAYSSALHLRPFLLSANALNGLAAVAEFQILMAITSSVVLIAGLVMTNLLPMASRALELGNRDVVDTILSDATQVFWILIGAIVFTLIACGDHFLVLYVGAEYARLYPWLTIWLIGLAYLYLSPAAAVVLASGKVGWLAASSTLCCILCLGITWVLAPKIGVGSAAVGIACYYVIQFCMYHIYALPKLLGVDPIRMVKEIFLPVCLAGAGEVLIARAVTARFDSLSESTLLLFTVAAGVVTYFALVHSFVMRFPDAYRLVRGMIGRAPGSG